MLLPVSSLEVYDLYMENGQAAPKQINMTASNILIYRSFSFLDFFRKNKFCFSILQLINSLLLIAFQAVFLFDLMPAFLKLDLITYLKYPLFLSLHYILIQLDLSLLRLNL